MAEAVLRDLAGDRFEIASAGYDEAPEICSDTIEAMREVVSIFWDNTQKKSLTSSRQRFAYLVTLCDREIERTCPIFPGVSWRLPVDNLASAQDDKERRVRDEIRQHVVKFIQEHA
jgi:protein-tyrosine-phosphatase